MRYLFRKFSFSLFSLSAPGVLLSPAFERILPDRSSLWIPSRNMFSRSSWGGNSSSQAKEEISSCSEEEGEVEDNKPDYDLWRPLRQKVGHDHNEVQHFLDRGKSQT